MRRLVTVAAGAAAVAVIAFAAFFVRSSGGGGVAWADMVNALARVSTVHMTGETFYEERGALSPLALHKDKWIRREPFAVYEVVTPVNPKTPQEAARRYVFAGNSAKVYWYFPDRGNRAVIGPGLQTGFMDDVLSPLGVPGGAASKPGLKVTGQSRVGGRKVILVELTAGKLRTEAAVDAQTKLTLRVRQFAVGAGGREIEATNLRFEYNQTPPNGIFEWTPPPGANIRGPR